MSLEVWKDMFHIAVQAKLRVDIGKLLDSREPGYIEPQLQDPTVDETADRKKKRDANNEKAILKAMKDHEERIKEWNEKKFGGTIRSEADGQIKSMLYMMLGSEARRQFQARVPHVRIVNTSLSDLWLHLDIVFHRERNISVDRVALISRRQRDDESLEQFHAVLTGLAAKCQLAHLEDELVRDVFIANMREPELQRRFYKKLRAPDEVLREVQAFERGAANQSQLKSIKAGRDMSPQREKQTLSIKQEPGIMRIAGNQKGRYIKEQHQTKQEACFRCGKVPFVKGHQLKCPARGQECRACGKMGHFEKVCGQNGKNPRARPGKVKLIRENDGSDVEMEDQGLGEKRQGTTPNPQCVSSGMQRSEQTAKTRISLITGRQQHPDGPARKTSNT